MVIWSYGHTVMVYDHMVIWSSAYGQMIMVMVYSHMVIVISSCMVIWSHGSMVDIQSYVSNMVLICSYVGLRVIWWT